MSRRRGRIWIAAGLLLMMAGAALTAYNLWDAHRAEQSAVSLLHQLQSQMAAQTDTEPSEMIGLYGYDETVEGEIPDYILNPNMEMPTQTVDGWDFIGVVQLSSIDVELPVITQWSDAASKVAPCRYSGSAYTDTMVIAAHNYRAYFRDLKNMQLGDAVIFTDVDGNVFQYQVAVTETLPPTAVEEMISGQWDLTLFTCTTGGQYRVAVRCDRING